MLASKPKRWMRSLALVFTLFLFCGWVPRAAGRDLIIGHSGTVSHLDPHFSRPTGHSHIYSNLYDTLVTRNHQLDLVPGLAMSWTLLDAQTWQFRLRQGVVFHNGHALTAEDVKFSLERAAHEQPCSSVFTSLNSISHVRILDSPTVNVVTRWPDPQLPARLSSNGGMILPGDYFEELGMERFSRQPIGTGPLKFVAWREDAGIIFEGNRQYWRPPAPYARVIFKAYPAPAARLTALLSGKADLVTGVSPDHMEEIDNSGVARVVSTLAAGSYAHPMNVRQPPLDNKLIRQALHLGIDRHAIVQQLWRGRAAVPTDVYPKLPGRRVALDAPYFRFDSETARELLAKAGCQGEEVLLEAAVGALTKPRELTETLASMFRRIGINARVHWLETPERVERLRQKTLPGMILSAPTSPLLDPDNAWWGIMRPGGLYDYWRHLTWDALMAEAQLLHAPTKRQARYQQAAEIFLDEMPVLIVLQPEELVAFRNELHWRARSDAVIRVSDIGAGEAPLSK